MKKVSLVVVALLLATFNLPAQSKSSSGGKCFDENSHVLNLGIGFGSRAYYNYGRGLGWSYRVTPALSLSYEQALKKPLGPGLLGLGGYFGFQRATYKYDDYYYNGTRYYYSHNWTYMFLAVRGAYHADALTFEKGELYFGASLGLRIQTYKYETNSPDPNRNYYSLSEGSIYPGYSLFVGGRYYFTNSIGVFGELGYGISYFTAGLSFKF